MKYRYQKWWQQIQQHQVMIVVVIIVAGVLVFTVVLGYLFNWDWTGLGSYTPPTKDSNFQRGKTLWDWMQLLIIPVVLVIGGYLFSLATSRNDQKSIQQRDQIERDIASDNQREAVLQSYIDKMSEFLLEKHLRESKEEDEVRTIARVRTLTVLPRLDTNRKGSVLQFLYESNLIDKDTGIIDLNGANLAEANLKTIDLAGANLKRVNLSGTDMQFANLREANLLTANLRQANLEGAYLSGADLSGALLSEANLSEANLSGTLLRGADLRRADLRGAYLRGANFSGANLYQANLSGTLLRGADLSEADLTGAMITEEQLNQAKLLIGATMPDGSIHP